MNPELTSHEAVLRLVDALGAAGVSLPKLWRCLTGHERLELAALVRLHKRRDDLLLQTLAWLEKLPGRPVETPASLSEVTLDIASLLAAAPSLPRPVCNCRCLPLPIDAASPALRRAGDDFEAEAASWPNPREVRK